MRRGVTTRFGFSLVELLVAIAVLGILIGAILALTSGFLGFSRRISVVNDRLVDLNDAMGYVGLAARSSMRTYGGTTAAQLSIGSDIVECSIASIDGPCVAFLVPVVGRDVADLSPVTSYSLLAYRIVPISEWGTLNPGVAPGWDGLDTPILLEHRALVPCAASCDVVPSIPNPVVIGSTALVISDLFIEAGDVPLALGASDDAFTIALRVSGSGQLTDLRIPNDGPLALTTFRRP